jgi:hypothetical protein
VLDDVAVELDLVEDASGPVRKVSEPAGVDPAGARIRLRLDPCAGGAVGQGPCEAGEDAGAVRPEELVGLHGRFHFRKAASSLSRVSAGTSSSVICPTVVTVVRIWSRYQDARVQGRNDPAAAGTAPA